MNADKLDPQHPAALTLRDLYLAAQDEAATALARGYTKRQTAYLVPTNHAVAYARAHYAITGVAHVDLAVDGYFDLEDIR